MARSSGVLSKGRVSISRGMWRPSASHTPAHVASRVGLPRARSAQERSNAARTTSNAMAVPSARSRQAVSVPFHPIRDFQPVSLAAKGTLMLVANPKTGIHSLAELLARAKASPGQLAYGSPGVGTPHHLAMELVKTRANIDMLHVPYKGTSG